MKKVLITILIIVLVLLVATAAAAGYLYWYRNTHIFVEDAVYAKDTEVLDLRGTGVSIAHYESVRSQLPDCEIFWDVPFQGGSQSNDITELTIKTLSAEDIARMDYFENLKKVDATDCTEYSQLEALAAHRPELKIEYSVDIGGNSVSPDVTELTLAPGEYDYAVLMENLPHLPLVKSISFPRTELTLQQIEDLEAAYEAISVSCTVELLGSEYDPSVPELDLSSMTSEDVAAVTEKFGMLPNVTAVELMNAEGKSNLSLTDVQALQEAAPAAAFHYTFEFFGQTLSTDVEEVKYYGKRMGDEVEEQLRQVLDVLDNCKRFVLEYCSISNDVLAQIRDDYRDRTKLVWRVNFGGGSTMTDAEVIRCTYDLLDDNCHDLIYCEDARYIDIGHNEFLDGVPFVAGMPNLEVIIVSGAPIKDLSPFANCKKLRVLEIAFCHYIEDISPLASCESLEMVNLGYTQVSDLSALDDKDLELLCLDHAKVSAEERNRFAELQPDCWITFGDTQPYGEGWRYDSNNDPLPWYQDIQAAFRYPDPPNNVGWYLQ